MGSGDDGSMRRGRAAAIGPVAMRRRTVPTGAQIFSVSPRRLPAHQALLDAADGGVEHERERRQHDDAGHHRVDVEGAFGLQDQVADAARRAEVFADHRADEGQADRGVQELKTQLVALGR